MRLFSDVSAWVTDPYLRRALSLAEIGRGNTAPNPLVGCVIVRDDEVVGEAYHHRAGEPHAEVLALREAGELARGATAYVTLEPCNHFGRTPPCSLALIEAGIRRVVVGMRDPNPNVAPAGANALRAAGIDVAFDPDPVPFEVQNEAWLFHVRTGLPFVRVKVAVSLDAHPALVAGRPAAISGISGGEITRRMRERADAVLVGAATVAADDPALTARTSEGVLAERQPLRVVLAGGSPLPPRARVFTDGLARTLVVAPAEAATVAREALPADVDVAGYDSADGLRGAMHVLAEREVVDLLIEAGPHLLTSLWDDRLANEIVTLQAGGMAGAQAPALYLGAPNIAAETPDTLLHTMSPLEVGVVGDVAVTVWRPWNESGWTPHNDGTLAVRLGSSSSPDPREGEGRCSRVSSSL